MTGRSLLLMTVLGCCGGHRAAVAPTVTPAATPAPIGIRVEWPDGSLYRGGVGWTMDGTCADGTAVRFGVDQAVASGEWSIEWPEACPATAMDLRLDLAINWTRCPPPPRVSQRVAPGASLTIRLAGDDDCREHADDP